MAKGDRGPSSLGVSKMNGETWAPCPICARIGGFYVQCVVCGRYKAPRGRSVPMAMANGMCEHECPGHYAEPHPDDLWPRREAW